MKIARLLLIVALFGISCSVARADGTDPRVFTQGCGGSGQPACDTIYLTPPGSTEVPGVSAPVDALDNLTFTFLAASDPSNPYGVTAAFLDLVNISGTSVGSFLFNFDPEDSTGEALTYSCGTAPEGSTGGFTCEQTGPGSFLFTGNTICSVPTSPPPCQFGERFGLLAGPGDPTDLAGQTVGATFFAPEPSSGLLLLIGLAAGVFVLRMRSFSLA